VALVLAGPGGPADQQGIGGALRRPLRRDPVPETRSTVGLATLVVGLGYFLVVTGLVMPALAGERYGYWHFYPELGESPRQMVEHVLRHPLGSLQLLASTPEKRHTIHLMFASFAYLPVLSWTVWPMLFMTLVERFWSISVNLWLFRFHFQVLMTTVLFVATVYALHDLGPRISRPRAPALAASIAVFLAPPGRCRPAVCGGTPSPAPPGRHHRDVAGRAPADPAGRAPVGAGYLRPPGSRIGRRSISSRACATRTTSSSTRTHRPGRSPRRKFASPRSSCWASDGAFSSDGTRPRSSSARPDHEPTLNGWE
jgi:hypothetical protein